MSTPVSAARDDLKGFLSELRDLLEGTLTEHTVLFGSHASDLVRAWASVSARFQVIERARTEIGSSRAIPRRHATEDQPSARAIRAVGAQNSRSSWNSSGARLSSISTKSISRTKQSATGEHRKYDFVVPIESIASCILAPYGAWRA